MNERSFNGSHGPAQTNEPRAAGDRPGSPRQDAILEAALELFSEHTFDGTPVPEVARRAGVAAGTVYRYFRSKEALVNELYRRCKLAMARALAEGASPATPREEFARLWRNLWRFAREQPAAFRFLEMHHHPAYLDAESRAVSERVMEPVVDFIARAQASGHVREAPPAVLIAMAFGAFVGLVKEAHEGHLDLDEINQAASEEAAWALLRAEPAAAGTPRTRPAPSAVPRAKGDPA